MQPCHVVGSAAVCCCFHVPALVLSVPSPCNYVWCSKRLPLCLAYQAFAIMSGVSSTCNYVYLVCAQAYTLVLDKALAQRCAPDCSIACSCVCTSKPGPACFGRLSRLHPLLFMSPCS